LEHLRLIHGIDILEIINDNLEFAQEIYKELAILKNLVTKWDTSKKEQLEKYREKKEMVLSKGLKYFDKWDEIYNKVLTYV